MRKNPDYQPVKDRELKEYVSSYPFGDVLYDWLQQTNHHYPKSSLKQLEKDITSFELCLGNFKNANMKENDNKWISLTAKAYANRAENRLRSLYKRVKDIKRIYTLSEQKSSQQHEKNENYLIKLVGELASARMKGDQRVMLADKENLINKLNEVKLTQDQIEEMKVLKIAEVNRELRARDAAVDAEANSDLLSALLGNSFKTQEKEKEKEND